MIECFLLDLIPEVVKKYARRYPSYSPTSYVLAKRGEYIKDTFGRACHRKLAPRAGHT
jgi:hypothetical protein